MTMTFAVHGDFDFHITHNVLVARLSGVFNREGAELFETQFMHYARQLVGKPWGHFVDLTEFELGVPELQPVIERLVVWCIENGLQKSAQLYSESIFSQYYVEQMVIEKTSTFERKAFKDKYEAIAWLASFGFVMDENALFSVTPVTN